MFLTRPVFLAYDRPLAPHYSEVIDRQLMAPITAPIVSASQSFQLDSRNGTKN